MGVTMQNGKGSRRRPGDMGSYHRNLEEIMLNKEIHCPVCGGTLHRTVDGARCVQFISELDDSKRLGRLGDLPVASPYKKRKSSKPVDGVYVVSGRKYGRLRINDGSHHRGEVVARVEEYGRWEPARLYPLPKYDITDAPWGARNGS